MLLGPPLDNGSPLIAPGSLFSKSSSAQLPGPNAPVDARPQAPPGCREFIPAQPFVIDAVNRLIKRIGERAGFDFLVHIRANTFA
jgi:hypothetical protein